MYHSIIIAHRDWPALRQCLASIALSARACNRNRYEIIVADDGSLYSKPPDAPNLRVVSVPRVDPFNKSILLNLGIEAARGNVLTILDADMLVNVGFMNAPAALFQDPGLSKLCYRVRDLDDDAALALEEAGVSPASVEATFANYDKSPRAFEARGLPHTNSVRPAQQPLFGNSQFSVRREMLGDLRYDEGYLGRGYEDIDLNLRLWQQEGDHYRTQLCDQMVYHLPYFGPKDETWGPGPWNDRNKRRYMHKYGLHRREQRKRRQPA